MTDINKSSEQSLNAILSKLGVKTQEEVLKQGNKNTLGQEDFLKLMTAQLQNQDPFAPMDNGDFIAQMAQFSTVTGITEINNNLTNLGSFALAGSSPGKVPGEMMLAVMPSGPNSAARDFVRPQTACFATATGDAPG